MTSQFETRVDLDLRVDTSYFFSTRENECTTEADGRREHD